MCKRAQSAYQRDHATETALFEVNKRFMVALIVLYLSKSLDDRPCHIIKELEVLLLG